MPKPCAPGNASRGVPEGEVSPQKFAPADDVAPPVAFVPPVAGAPPLLDVPPFAPVPPAGTFDEPPVAFAPPTAVAPPTADVPPVPMPPPAAVLPPLTNVPVVLLAPAALMPPESVTLSRVELPPVPLIPPTAFIPPDALTPPKPVTVVLPEAVPPLGTVLASAEPESPEQPSSPKARSIVANLPTDQRLRHSRRRRSSDPVWFAGEEVEAHSGWFTSRRSPPVAQIAHENDVVLEEICLLPLLDQAGPQLFSQLTAQQSSFTTMLASRCNHYLRREGRHVVTP